MSRVAIVCTLMFLIPGVAGQTQVEVPNQVVGTQVVVKVTDIDTTGSPAPTKLVMTIGTGSAAVTEHSLSGLGSTSTGAVTFLALGQAGLVPWTLAQHDGSTATTLAQGHVFVQDAFSGIDAAIAAVKADVSALSTKVSDLESEVGNTTVSDELSDLEAQLTALQAAIANVGTAVTAFEETNFTKILQAAAPPAEEETVTAAPSTLSVVGTATNVTLAIAIIALVAIMQWQSRKRHQEAMVFMLAMAAKMKVTPDSPEFQTAVAALES